VCMAPRCHRRAHTSVWAADYHWSQRCNCRGEIHIEKMYLVRHSVLPYKIRQFFRTQVCQLLTRPVLPPPCRPIERGRKLRLSVGTDSPSQHSLRTVTRTQFRRRALSPMQLHVALAARATRATHRRRDSLHRQIRRKGSVEWRRGAAAPALAFEAHDLKGACCAHAHEQQAGDDGLEQQTGPRGRRRRRVVGRHVALTLTSLLRNCLEGRHDEGSH
jgi:hypothetical protein